jgi:hypothetical protein
MMSVPREGFSIAAQVSDGADLHGFDVRQASANVTRPRTYLPPFAAGWVSDAS